jgi:PAS domain S-box-containing protein
LPPGGLLGRSIREFTTPAQFALIREQTRQRGLGEKSVYEIDIRRADGEERSLLVTAVPHFDRQGQFAGTFGVFRNITERKRAEAARRASEEKYRLAVNATNDGVWDINLQDGTIHFNESYAATYGTPSENEDHLAWWTDHVHPDDRDQTLSSFNAALNASVDVWRCEYRFRRIDGTWANAYDRAHITRDSTGKAQYVVGALSDITERKLAETATKSQLDELERWQDVMLDREDRVQELKREVNALCKDAGKVARYPSQDGSSADAEAKRPTS